MSDLVGNPKDWFSHNEAQIRQIFKLIYAFVACIWHKIHFLMAFLYVFAVVQCGVPDEIQNGYILSVEGTSYEKTATYKCNAGFTKDPDTIAECNATGAWEKLPGCTGEFLLLSEEEIRCVFDNI